MEGLFFLVILWVACAVLAAMLAPEGKKGLAAVLGFLFGPFGLLIAVLMKK
ncbi:MAG: hypothetical protein GDA40_01790 [Rhodobacteraceae bacterium]|nr:hypothetical protein [Paracoccaceae bacterium]